MMAPPANLLLIGFDEDRSTRLGSLLAGGRFKVNATPDQKNVESCDISLVFISADEPTRGLRLIEEVRPQTDAAVIAIAEAAGPALRVAAVDAGADDILIEPYEAEELLASIRALFRRCIRCRKISKLQYGTVTVDQIEQRFNWNNVSVPLSRMELRLLQLLIVANGFTVRTEILLRELWGNDDESRRQSLRVLVRSLRRKIETNPTEPAFIINEFGVGYHLRRIDMTECA